MYSRRNYYNAYHGRRNRRNRKLLILSIPLFLLALAALAYFILPEYSLENLRTAMENGNFFAVARYAKNELGEDFEGKGDYPRFMAFDADEENQKITVKGINCNAVEWIADGKIIKEYDVADEKNASFDDVLDLDTIEGAENFTYVRVELFGEGGICASQAFVIDNGTAPLEFAAEEVSPLD